MMLLHLIQYMFIIKECILKNNFLIITYVSNSMRLASTGADDSSEPEGAEDPAGLLAGSGSSSGLGCMRVKGSSATKSL